MAWIPVISNIITETDLNTTLTNYSTDLELTNGLSLKLSVNNGVASGLSVTPMGDTDDSVTNKKYVDDADDLLSARITALENIVGIGVTP
jgi:hypothetical protein